MSEYIDVLTPQLSNCPTFTVDTTGPLSVDLTAPVPECFYGGNGTSDSFIIGESLIFLSIGYKLPDNFTIYEGNLAGDNLTGMSIRLFVNTIVGGMIPLYQFGPSGKVKVPFSNYEMSLGVFVQSIIGGIGDTHFQLYYDIENPIKISMVNVPATLNGQVLHLVPFIKVLHNFTMS